jgi:hypothetical protein
MAAHAAWAREIDERDSLDTLKIARLPVTHPVLRKARVVKDGRLNSMIELYRDESAGSAQYAVEDIPRILGLTPSSHPDVTLLRYICLLPAFDVFSVRLLLRDLGGSGPIMSELAPSPAVSTKIEEHMRKFTMPLLRYVYGSEDIDIANIGQLLNAFISPDVATAQAHLKRMADKLNMNVQKVPRFLEDYSDTFLAIAFYELTLERLLPQVDALLNVVRKLGAEPQFRNDGPVRAALRDVESLLPQILAAAGKRLQAVERIAESLWANHTGATLRAYQDKVREFQMLVGFILCGVSAKLTAWITAYADGSGSNRRLAGFIVSEFSQALQTLREAAVKGTTTVKLNANPALSLGKERADSFRAHLRAMAEKPAS